MKISIVMPSYNQAQFVDAAIESVLSQKNGNIEILFIDGGSTDGTMEKVKKYERHLDYCISEPDGGQSEALHKGFQRANGEILSWLNTDDILMPGALSEVEKAFNSSPDISWLLGNVVWIDSDNRILKCWKGEGYTPYLMKLGLFAAGGPSSFFKKELYSRVGGLNLSFHYKMDTELWWRFAIAGERYRRLNGYTWALRLHERAKMSGHMFVSELGEKGMIVENAKAFESTYIEEMTANFRIPISPIFSNSILIFRRFFSPRYLRGKYDNLLFRGKKLECIA